jgi:hypothetical protein
MADGHLTLVYESDIRSTCGAGAEVVMEVKNALDRDVVIQKLLNATTVEEIESAESALRSWVAAHPGDLGMRDGFEHLAMLRDAIEEQVNRPQSAIR